MSTISVPSSSTGIDSGGRRKPLTGRRQPLPAARRASFRAGLALAGLALAGLAATPAAADFRICNKTKSRVGVAIGYQNGEDWVTEGWWNIPANACEALLHGSLSARFYYVYAIDYDHNGEWSGPTFMCTRDKEFTIKGLNDCLTRGFDRTGFMEVDTGERQTSWTVELKDPKDPGQTPPATGKGFPTMPGTSIPRQPTQPIPGMPSR